MLLPNSRTARVVLPTKEEIDTDDEGDDLEQKGSQNPEEAVDVGDPLEDWPDDTEVRFTCCCHSRHTNDQAEIRI